MGLIIPGQVGVSSAGGSTIATGSYAGRPASPSRGDTYLVTQAARTGSYYRCLQSGLWLRAGLDLGLGDTPFVLFDAEDVPTQNGALLREWRPVGSGAPFALITGVTPPTIVTGSLGGMPAVSFTGTQALRLSEPFVKKGLDHTVFIVFSSLSASGNNGLLSIGDPTNTSGSVGLFGNFVSSLSTRAYVEYNATTTSIYDSGTTISTAAGPHVFVWTWESAAGKSRAYADGSPTATASHVPGTTLGVLADASQMTLGAGRCNGTALGTFYGHGLGAVPRRLSDAEVLSLSTLLIARFT